ncbi:MAG TPA: hypothetical protein PKB13_02700 [Clostridia bacterium]|nr:hypothetical protein [Clostridia bacterium]
MDRMIEFDLAGRKVHLNYSIDVMFTVIEQYGEVKKVLEQIDEDTRESFALVREMFLLLANDGELCRRAAGYDPQPFIVEQDISLRLSPYELVALREAIVKAIVAGYNRETKNEAEEVDVGLQKLAQKKTETRKAGEATGTTLP